MSKYFRFNDEKIHIIKMDNFCYSHSYIDSFGRQALEVVVEKNEEQNEEHNLYYEDKEVMKKDVARLARFLNKKEELL